MNNNKKREKLVANSKKIVADINQLYNEMLQLLSDEYIFDESNDSLDLSEAMTITRRLSADFMTSSKKILHIIETGETLPKVSDNFAAKISNAPKMTMKELEDAYDETK